MLAVMTEAISSFRVNLTVTVAWPSNVTASSARSSHIHFPHPLSSPSPIYGLSPATVLTDLAAPRPNIFLSVAKQCLLSTTLAAADLAGHSREKDLTHRIEETFWLVPFLQHSRQESINCLFCGLRKFLLVPVCFQS